MIGDQKSFRDAAPASAPDSTGQGSTRAALAAGLIVTAAAGVLRAMGRPWWCACGGRSPWSGAVTSRHNSQHLTDPYTFTHLLHGLLLYAVLGRALRRVSVTTRFVLAIALEAIWEVTENTDWVIGRYRAATIALGYLGDSIANSIGDIAACGVGFMIAARLPARWSVVLFVAVELGLIVWIRDGLLLNVLQLVHPVDAIKRWQMVH